jgi:hypothetical protein
MLLGLVLTASGQEVVGPAGAGRAAQAPEAGQGGAVAEPPAAAVPQTRMDALLAQWEQVSLQNETLYARFTRTDRSPALVVPREFKGQALLRKPNLACLDFHEVVPDKPKPVFEQRIVCSGDRVYQFLGSTKQVFVYHLAEDEKRRSVEEGPLPFLFNMRVARAKQRYVWELVKEQEAEPARPAAEGQPKRAAKPAAYIIRITPREAIDREEFRMALIMLNKETFLPEALQLHAPNGKDTKTFTFRDVERNGTQNPASNLNNFDGEKMAEKFREQGYKVIVNPDGSGAAQTAGQVPPGRGRDRQAVPKTAMPKSVRPR